MGDKDEYTPMSLVAGKSAQHLQSEGVEQGQSLVEYVGRMIDMLQLQMVGLHMQDQVDSVAISVNQVVADRDEGTKVNLVAGGQIFPVGNKINIGRVIQMVDKWRLQEELDKRVALEENTAVDLHEEVQDMVDGQDLPVNQAVTVVGGGTEENLEECVDSFSVEIGHGR